MIEVVLGLGFISVFFMFIAILTTSTLLKIPMWIASSMQALIILYLLWQDSLGNAISPLLGINFKVLLIVWGGGSLIGIFMFMYHTINVDDDSHAGDDKWLQAGDGGKWESGRS